MNKIYFNEKYNNIRLNIKAYYDKDDYTIYSTPIVNTWYSPINGYNKRIIDFLNLNINDYYKIEIEEV